MVEVRSSTEIEAPAETVWSVLTDLDGFRTWNPFIRHASGSTAVGGTVRVRVRPSMGGRLRFKATVLERDDLRTLHWRGHVLRPWFASGDHTFTIVPLDGDRTRLVQHERFTGIVPRLAGRLLAREARRGFDAMNAALDARARRVRRSS